MVLSSTASPATCSAISAISFSPANGPQPVTYLSGGERNRLLLARMFTQPANVLVLDEPTNDLDMETLELLEEMLVEFPGTLLLVSHDRAFLNNVVTSTLVFEGDGRVKEYVGGYDDWLRQKAAEPPPAAAERRQARAERPQAKPSRKLSYKEQRESKNCPSGSKRSRPSRRSCTKGWPIRPSSAKAGPKSPKSLPGWRRSKRN